ncbi:MAG: ribokinase [Anaerolineae bacterium]
MSIIVFGSINMDLTAYAPRLPRPGETLFGRSFITVPGGKGANQAVAAARLGGDVHFVGRVGDDAFGHEVLALVREQGVDMSAVMVTGDARTALAVIAVDDRAENAIIVISGANMTLDQQDVARCVWLLDGARVVLLQQEVPHEANFAVAQEAQRRGVSVILDPAPARELPDEMFPLLDFITPNELEAEALVGFRPTDADSAAQAARMLRDRGVRAAIIKMGAQGAFFDSPDSTGFVPAFPVKAVDTVAAGDAFNGGLAVALAQGYDIEQAVRRGAAAGAVAVTRPGAMPAMPYRHEVEQLLSEGTVTA